ncbi:MAG: hypothetical protein GY909_08900 [Oligoflexia bacterium]|nr:hypothetical protein [Oligoflexia bacterium]
MKISFILLSLFMAQSSLGNNTFDVVDRGFSKEVIAYISHERQKENINSIEDSKHPEFSETVKKIIDKLLSSSNLTYEEGELPRLEVNYSNDYRILSPKLKLGVLTVYPATFMNFKTEDQIAAVIANELVHHFRAHDQRLTKIELDPWPFKERRQKNQRKDHEIEADILSLYLLKNAGYNSRAPIEALLNLDSMFSKLPLAVTPVGIHKDIRERINRLEKEVTEKGESTPLEDGALEELLNYKNIYL